MRSNEQLAKIETLHEYTQVDKEECERVLERSDWNVEVAITRVLDANAQQQQDQPVDDAREPLLAGEQTVGPRRRIRGTQPGSEDLLQASAERPVPDEARERPVSSNPLRLIGSGLSLVGKQLVLNPLRSFTGINGDVSEDAAAAGFVERFEDLYGDGHPAFVCASYKEAMILSGREEKLLLLYLHAPEHPQTDEFCRNVLCSEEVKQLVDREMLCWGGSIRSSDAYRLADMLMVSTYPTLAVLAPSQAMSSSNAGSARGAKLVDRMEGLLQADQVLEKLKACSEQHKSVILQRRMRKLEAEERQRLREQQNREFEESERLDREREEERRRKEREEEDKRNAELERERERSEMLRNAKESLPSEPAPGSDVATSMIKFNLPNGAKFVRRFAAAHSLQTVRNFVMVRLDELELDIQNFALVLNYPKKQFDPDFDHEQTLQDLGLAPQAVLFVQDLDS